MQKIPLKTAQPDMILAKAVVRDNGVVLIAAGTVLSSSLIYRLENMGIEQVVVEGSSLDAQGNAEELAQKRERLNYLFRNFKDDHYMQQAKKIIDDYYVQRSMALVARAQKDGGTA